jgi:hypothetical protein
MSELTIDGKAYRTGRLDARTQFHIVRRILPALASLTSVDRENTSQLELVGVLAGAIAKLEDADCDYILSNTLSRCMRQDSQAWVPVWNVAANRLQYEDITLPTMIQLTAATLSENLGSFFPDPGVLFQSASSPPSAPTS